MPINSETEADLETGEDVVSDRYRCCEFYPNNEILKKIKEINNFYEAPEDMRVQNGTGKITEAQENWWLWNRPTQHHTMLSFCNYYYSAMIESNGTIMILCAKCYRTLSNTFWEKVAYNVKDVSLMLVHEHTKGHLNCDICAVDTCNNDNSLICYWGEISKRREIVKLWSARED